MDKIIFRREEDTKDEPTSGSYKNIYGRKRKSTAPVLSFFSEVEKTMLTKNLFNRDIKQFNLFMTELDNQSNWHDAFLFIDQELKKRKIDVLGHKAKYLTDRVYQVFFPEDVLPGN